MATDPWTDTTLGALCDEGGLIQTGPFGSQLHAEDYTDSGVPVVMPTNIGDNLIEPEGIAKTSESNAERLSRHRLQPNDIVYPRRGEIRKRALVRPSQEGWLCGTGCLLVRPPKKTCDARWLSYWLGAPWTTQWLIQHAVGATMPNLNTQVLSDVPVSLPPLPIQRRIAVVLGALDDLIETNGRLIRALLGWIEGAFRCAVRESTRKVPVAEIVDVHGGSTPSTREPAYWGGGIAWATPRDLARTGSVPLLETERTITSEGLARISSGLLPAGTVLMSSRAPVGYLAIAEVPVAVNQGFIALTCDGPVPSLFMWQWLKANMDQVKARASGSTFQEISKAAFRPIEVDIPTGDALNTFVSAADSAYRQVVESEKENRELRQARDELLPLLMSGRVSPGEVDLGV